MTSALLSAEAIRDAAYSSGDFDGFLGRWWRTAQCRLAFMDALHAPLR